MTTAGRQHNQQQQSRATPRSAPAVALRHKRRGPSLTAHGEPMVWLIGGGLAICSLMILALLALVVFNGAATFWPRAIVELTTADGQVIMGPVARGEYFEAGAPVQDDAVDELVPEAEAAPGAEAIDVDQAVAQEEAAEAGALGLVRRDLIQVGNRELFGTPFQWVSRATVEQEHRPDWAIFAERRTWGPMVGTPAAFIIDGEEVAASPSDAWALFEQHHPAVRERHAQRRQLERVDSGSVNDREEAARLHLVQTRLRHGRESEPYNEALAELEAVRAWAQQRHAEIRTRIDALNDENDRYRLVTSTSRVDAMQQDAIAWTTASPTLDASLPTPGGDFTRWRIVAGSLTLRIESEPDPDGETTLILAVRTGDANELIQTAGTARLVAGAIDARTNRLSLEFDADLPANLPVQASYRVQQQRELPLDQIVRAYPANQLSVAQKLGIYLDRWWEFLTERPREANTEGGVLPPIVGTVTMTLLMCFIVVPFGVLAALYLREYAKAGPIVSAVRIAVNNLAGVPSIVFGVFGLGFFCYIVGDFIDSGPTHAAPNYQWIIALTVLVLVTVAAAGATFLRLRATDDRQWSVRMLGYVTTGLWIVVGGVVLWLIIRNPFFGGFYPAQAAEGNPVFNKGGVLWASLTLALLTLPVVIVATEEALAAVPGSMREGSYACGASKWQTIRRIVLPRAMPGIMTGMILAMARGAGEVAPLMLVGAVTMAQELPISASAPFLHLDRSFMHLGFHIYDVGFQSPDSEGAKPMVYTTTLLLIGIIAVLNLSAFLLRTRLRRRFADGQF